MLSMCSAVVLISFNGDVTTCRNAIMSNRLNALVIL
jgi:hypothetical protein